MSICLAFVALQSGADNHLAKSNIGQMGVYVQDLYKRIDFGQTALLKYAVFENAYKGYTALKNAGKINLTKNIIAICDYSMSSVEKRFWIIDLDSCKVLFNTLMAHGQGSGEEFAVQFSNKENSHQTSLGFFVTGDTYMGKHGLSLYLNGMDKGFNDAALQRAVVMHGAEYVSQDFINQHQRLGRSWGCPALPISEANAVIELLKNGSCFYAYFPSEQFLQNSYWLNNKRLLDPDFNILLTSANKDGV